MKKHIKIFLVIVLLLLINQISQKILQLNSIRNFSLKTAGLQTAKLDVENVGEGNYVYETLDDAGKLVYNQIVDALENFEKDATVSTSNEELLEKAYIAVMGDHPEIFWVQNYGFSIYEVGGIVADFVFQPIYTMTKEEAGVKQTQIDLYVKSCLSGISEYASEYEKVKYVYEYLIRNTDYNIQAENSQNICSVFINKESVCMGYSKALQYVLKLVEVECTTLSGTADGEAHAWNLVKVDGDYYYVDVTWGKPRYQENDMDRGDSVNYAYLCVTTEEFFRSHEPDDAIPLPICTSISYNYYVQEGRYLSVFNKQKIKEMITGTLKTEDGIGIKCADKYVYDELYHYLIEEANIRDFTKSSGISYIEDVRNYILTIYI